MRSHRYLNALFFATALGQSPLAAADVVLDWNEIGLARVLAARQLPPDASRSLAIMHLAMFDAATAAQSRGVASTQAATAAAAHAALIRLFPGEAQALDAAYAASIAGIDTGAGHAGAEIGRAAAARRVQLRERDGSGIAGPYKPRVQAGVYVATAYPVSSEWARVKPFVMDDSAQFRPPPPPSLDSPVWARDLEEIRAVGSRASTSRSREQTDVARFWTVTGPPSWNPLVRALAQARSAGLVDNARLFAQVYVAATDAFIAVFDAKYAHEFWRPVTAVRHGGSDPAWLPLVDTPMHPEYPCAHCISSAAVATVLEAHFGKGSIAPVSMTSPTAPGVTRTWSRISDYVTEVSNARVWGGIHYRNSTVVGEQMGRRIGALAVERPLVAVEASREPAPATLSAR